MRTAQENTTLSTLRATTDRTADQNAEMAKLDAIDDSAPAGAAPGIMMTVGEYVTSLLSFTDDYPALGVMDAPAAGTVSESEPNVVKSSVTLTTGPAPQAILRLDAMNVGKTVVHYRLDDVAVAIPVEVVRRVPKAVSIDPNGITRARLP